MKCLACTKKQSKHYVRWNTVILMLCDKCMYIHVTRDPDLLFMVETLPEKDTK